MTTKTRNRLKTIGLWTLRVLAAVLITGVLLSITESNQWWIRAWDFPRAQLLVVMFALSVALWVYDRRNAGPWLPLALVMLCLWQAWRIYPYSALAPVDVAMADAETAQGGACFSVLSLNVLQTNREYGRTTEMLERIDPDILLLMETDQAWIDAMTPVTGQYAHVTAKPLDNKYGLLFASRLPVRDARIRDLAQKDTPSIMATMTVADQDFHMIGLHPRPPRPGQDTEERDAELIVAAKEARAIGLPAIAIGDFNDVAWSDTTRLFMQMGQFIDPRIGRGTYATFPADMTYLGWPLDHVFVTEQFLMKDMRVLDPVGSDHRPILAEFCLNPSAGRAQNAEAEDATAENMREAETVMDEFDEDTAEDKSAGE